MNYRLPNPHLYASGGVWLWGAIAELITLILAPWASTQYIASQFGFQASLGAPWCDLRQVWTWWSWLLCVLLVEGVWFTSCALWKRTWIAAMWIAIGIGCLYVAMVMPIYPPWMFAVWMWYGVDVPHTLHIWENAIDLIVIAHLAPLMQVSAQITRAKGFAAETDLHGSDRWANEEDLKKGNLL